MGLVNFINVLTSQQQEAATRNLLSVAEIDPIEVEYGTAFEDLDLPTSVIGTFSSGSPSPVALEWLEGDYDTVYGTYTLYADIVLDGFTNDGDIQAEIEVGVLPEAIDPETLGPFILLDAEDYAVGAISNGTTLTDHGTGGAGSITVAGTTLTVQVNADGKKEFVGDGSTHLLCDTQNAFNFLHNGTNSNYTILFIGKIGTTSNPDAVYFLCGNSAGSSTTIGISLVLENRVAQSATHGSQLLVARGVSSSLPINARTNALTFNTRKAYAWTVQMSGILMDHIRMFDNGDLLSVHDRVRTTSHTTSGLGTTIAFSASNPSNKFQILSGGTGSLRLVGKVEKFMIFPSVLTENQIRGINAFCGIPADYGKTSLKYLVTNQTLTNDYALGGLYSKSADKSKTNFITSIGPDHFAIGSDRKIMSTISTDDGFTWPAYTELFADATTSPQGGIAGGRTSTGRLIMIYGKYTTATGAYVSMVVRYSDDDGTTWSSEYSVTIPTTSPALTGWNVLDQIEECDNGDLIITWYGASGTSLYNLYVMKSTDDGETWTNILVDTSGSVYRNEGSIVNLGGGNLLALYRVEVAVSGSFVYQQYFSDDSGATWTNQGQTSFGVTLFVYAHPVILRRFELDGTRVIAAYFVNRGTRRFYVVYCTAAELISDGLSAWSGKTVYHLDNRLYGANVGWESGYPNVIHPDNDLKAEGIYSEETTNDDVCTINFFKIDDEHKARIKTELSI